MRLASQLFVAVTAAAIVTPVAGAAEVSSSWEQEAQAPAPETPHFTTYSAQGTTWAPGGTAASNSIYVKGQGTHVEWARVSYMIGTDLGNACADEFQIIYRQNGEGKSQTSEGYCKPGRVHHEFPINANVDRAKFCGRAKVGGSWGNFACIDIK
ncbi:hypothetical protein [Corynebacterium macginleyi]|uniref:hypothetical protein n=1 Tax=Corynebacterium macginleyi TaxID=38290 RepID=UPI00190CD76F|nr:hypothetical protein [Corynebacterium macginleyi]MBK4162543.1 hypothetical protein [Corynebacterium macginleyi]QRJ59678.1 hypothetical protein GWO70_009445 [Corynebacterium macginleyi]